MELLTLTLTLKKGGTQTHLATTCLSLRRLQTAEKATKHRRDAHINGMKNEEGN